MDERRQTVDTILHILGRQPCMMQKLTGLYCPGCGGTRAVRALLAGHPLQSFLYHPFVLYEAVLMGILIFFRLAEKVSRGKIRRLSCRPVWLWIGVLLIVGNWILRNILLLVFHIPIG